MSHHESAAKGADARLVDRMLFFTDAVFAIVLTLLALEMRPPPASVQGDEALLQGILATSKVFASYFVSFALGAAFWVAHLRTSRMLHVWDWPTTLVNLIHLVTVGLLPYAASLLGQHIGSGIAFYGYSGIVSAVSLTGALFWLTATRDKGRLVGGMDWRRRIAGFLRTAALGIAFGSGIVITFVLHRPEIGRYGFVLVIPIVALSRVLAGGEKI